MTLCSCLFALVLHAFGGGGGGVVVPSVDSIVPSLGTIGSTVTINGRHFSSIVDQNRVSFGGVDATIVSATESTLVVTVPVAARFSPVTVASNGLISRSSQRFSITFDATEPFNASHLEHHFPSPYVGSGVKGIGWGDLDGDGSPEIITTQGHGDIDGDGRLDIVASEYGDVTDDFDSHTCIFINTGTRTGGNGAYDLNDDGFVGGGDLGLLLSLWGSCA